MSDEFYRPVWLADSRHLIGYVDSKMQVLDTQTKQMREILSLLPQFISSPNVTPDNSRVVFSTGTIESDILMLTLP